MKIKNIFLSNSTPLRSVRQFTTAFVCCSALGLLAGCATEPESHVVSAPPPPEPVRSISTTTTTTSPYGAPAVVVGNAGATVLVSSATPPVSTTVVTEAPPALQSEVVLAQPAPGYVWLAGY